MIILPTRQRLERRRDKLYIHLHNIVNCASVCQVEDIMRQIHGINLRLKTYFKPQREPQEYFNPLTEDNDITTQDTTPGEVSPSDKDLAEIEAEIREGKI